MQVRLLRHLWKIFLVEEETFLTWRTTVHSNVWPQLEVVLYQFNHWPDYITLIPGCTIPIYYLAVLYQCNTLLGYITLTPGTCSDFTTPVRDQAIHCLYGSAGSMQRCGKSFTGKDDSGNIEIYFIVTIVYKDLKKKSHKSFGRTRCSWGCPKISLKHGLAKK